MNKQITVLQIVSTLETGGAQEVVRTLATELRASGCRTVVCTFKDGSLRQEIEREGIQVIVLPSRRHTFLHLPLFILEMYRLRSILLSIVTDLDVDVVQTHLLRSLDFLTMTLRLSSKAPRIFITIHNQSFTLRDEHLMRRKWLLSPKRWLHRTLYRVSQALVDGYIAVSPSVAPAISDSLDVSERKVVTICNGVNMRRYERRERNSSLRSELGLRGSDRVLIAVASLVPQKGHSMLIQALPSVLRRFPEVQVLLVGDGHLRQHLLDEATGLGISGRIRFLGLRADVPDLLAISDVFVLPSLWEGLPMALIEAMAAGLPALATDVSGSRDVVVSGETGLLVPAGNVRELEHGLARLLSDPEGARRMGLSARQRVAELFSAQRQARDHVALYRRAMSARSA
jgi:glycosyltransferase involved in cell wall biosynthesis